MGKKSLAALLCATMAMTACMLPATAAMADEPLKIEFFQQKGEEGPQKGYKEIIDKFNKENSDIEIEMNTVPDAGTVLTSRISSGDIFQHRHSLNRKLPMDMYRIFLIRIS